MNYEYSTNVRDNDALRASFNELTRQTFCFDFVNWYEVGHWGDYYIPHVLLDGEKVISNVSVNLMQFDLHGVKKNYIQLGTVMTDKAYRGQGLNREIMERILAEYVGKVDGIYLFGNDDVLQYYPKFGFVPAKEFEYYLPCDSIAGAENAKHIGNARNNESGYTLTKVNMQDKTQAEKLYESLRSYEADSNKVNQNDAMYMNENVCLYQFWLAAGYGDKLYYISEADAYIVVELEEDRLHVYQIFGKQEVDVLLVAKAIDNKVKEIVFGYTPTHKENYLVREHKEEDCTLFILGEDLERIERDAMMFPVLSHA